MEKTLYRLESSKVIEYLQAKLRGVGLYPNLIADVISSGNAGEFYVIVPNDLSPDCIYDFDTGLKFKGLLEFIDNNTAVKHDVYSDWLVLLCQAYIKRGDKYILLEDLSSSPEFEYVKKNKIRYYQHGDHLIYILNNEYSENDIADYLWYSRSWLTFGLFAKCEPHLKLNSNNFDDVEVIEPLLQAGFFEVYDGESLLFWIRDEEVKLLECIDYFVKKNS